MISFVLGSLSYTLIDEGIANLLAIETLRHGTNLIDYIKIRYEGGDPIYAGKSTNHPHTKNYFYLFKDTEMHLTNFEEGEEKLKNILTIMNNFIPKRIFPRIFATISGFHLMYNLIPANQSSSSVVKITKKILGIIGGSTSFLLCPTLKFRFDKIDHTRLEDDNSFWGTAYKTRQKAEPWRIGILGSLLTGINYAWCSRVKKQPLKALKGVIQLTTGIGLTILALKASQTSLMPLIIGGILA